MPFSMKPLMLVSIAMMSLVWLKMFLLRLARPREDDVEVYPCKGRELREAYIDYSTRGFHAITVRAHRKSYIMIGSTVDDGREVHADMTGAIEHQCRVAVERA